jgi:hypothetical protein
MKNTIFMLLLFAVATLSAKAQNNDDAAYFIQVASYGNPKYKDFSKIHQLGYMFEMGSPNGVSRVMIGTFSTQGAATQRLRKAKELGYKDAFVTKVEVLPADGVYVLQLATFGINDPISWAEWKRLAGNNLHAQMNDDKIRILMGEYKSEADAKKALGRIQQQAPKDVMIRRVSSKVIHKVTDFEMSRTKSKASVATNTPRQSVRNMQQFLNKEGGLKSSADGVWGKETQSAANQYELGDTRYQSYQMLAERLPMPSVEEYSLQYYINMIAEKPITADEGLKQFQHPLAKVYRAYMYLHGDVQIPNYQGVVNELMNVAADQVFGGYQQPTRSDFKMNYAYNNIEQLIRHLREIHEAVRDEPQVPCWLFKRHPDMAAEAFAPYWNSARDNYDISSDCGSFLAMPEIRILTAISRDFSERPDEALSRTDISQLNRIFALPTPPTKTENSDLEAWQTTFWANLKVWETGTALQKNIYHALQYAFFDAQVAIEDHFIADGYSSADARGLALLTLKTAIAHYYQ